MVRLRDTKSAWSVWSVWSVWPARVALLACLLVAAAPAQEDSLEDYLERARVERAALLARLAPEIDPLLERVADSEQRPSEARVSVLAQFGAEATPLLVAHLDPGPEKDDDKDDSQERVADYVARALERMSPSPILADLLRMLEHGSPSGRVRAARVLAFVPDPPAVLPSLRATFESSTGELKRACLRSLVRVDGPGNAPLLAKVLGADDEELVNMALQALAETESVASAGNVAALLADPTRATRHAQGLLGYYRALPDLADEDVIEDLVGLVRRTAPTEVKLAVLAALPEFKPRLVTLRRSLAPFTESRDRDLREAAQTALATLGDRSARRDLLESYDEVINRNKRWSQAWSRRADVLRRIRDFDAAIRDYKEALDLGENDPAPDRESHIGLARCYALKGKEREAAEWLRRAPITLKELRALADDPDFAELRDSRWGAEAFALEDSP